MMRSRAVHDRYQLHPQDLTASAILVTIRNVSYQGLEKLNPVLHLAEYPAKRLVLDPHQCAALTRITQSAVAQQWIDRVIVLRVEKQNGAPVITLAAPPTIQPLPVTPPPRSVGTGKLWSILLLLLVLAAALGAVYLIENLDQLR